MSYLRSTCSDAAVRATNLRISRYIPAVRPGDAQSDEIQSNAESNFHDGDFNLPQRLPSRRPLDRRWDESRGLVFDGNKTALRNYTWTPTRGIVFGRGTSQRRTYAMRPSRTSMPQGTPSSAQEAYGSALPDMERLSDETTEGRKSTKQVELEGIIDGLRKEVRGNEAKLLASEEETKKTKERVEDLERRLSAGSEAVAKAKRIEQEADRTLRAERKQLKEQMKDEYSVMQQRVIDAEMKYPKLEEELERRRVAQEESIKKLREKQMAQVDVDIQARYAVLNNADKAATERQRQEAMDRGKIAERIAELQRMEEELAKRKKDRADYTTYRDQFDLVNIERKVLDESFKDLQFSLERDLQRITKERELQRSVEASQQAKNGAPNSLEAFPTEDELRTLKDRIQVLSRIRNDLSAADVRMKITSHESRLATNAARFKDTTLAADAQLAVLQSTGNRSGKAIRARTEREISDLTRKIEAATNATLRNELFLQREALRAEYDVVCTYLRLLHLDQDIQYYETLKLEPYARKAVIMGIIDLRIKADSLRRKESFAVYENDEGVVSGRAKTGNWTRASKWRDLQLTIERLEIPIKKRAQLLEHTGQHHAHEKELDKEIDARIADAVEALRSRRTKLFADRKEARAAARRAPSVRARPKTEPHSAVRETRSNSKTTPQTFTSKKGYNTAIIKIKRLNALLSDPDNELDFAGISDLEGQMYRLQLKVNQSNADRLRERLPSSTTVEKKKKRLAALAASEQKVRILQEKLAAMASPGQQSDGSLQTEQLSSGQPKSLRATQRDLSKRLSDQMKQLTDPNNGLDAEGVASLERRIALASAERAHVTIEKLVREKNELGPETPGNAKKHKSLDVVLAKQRAILSNIERNHQNGRRRRNLRARSETSRSQDAPTSQSGQAPQSNTDTAETPATSAEPPSKTSLDANETPSKVDSPATETSPTASGRLNFTSTKPQQAAYGFSAGRAFYSGRIRDSLSQVEFDRRMPMSSQLSEGVSRLHHAAFAPADEYLVSHHTGGMNVASSHDRPTSDGVPERDTEAASLSLTEDDAAKNQALDRSASDFSPTSTSPCASTNITEASSTMTEHDEEILINYEISRNDLRNALIASPNSTASHWKYSMYKNAAGEPPTRHYCTTYEQTEAQLAKFVDEKVVGFDLEWEKASKPGVSSAKRSVSLMQIAAQDKIALFHLAVFRGRDSPDDLLPPALRAFLENPQIIKAGVNIGGDATRLKNCFGVKVQGCIELSHLYKLVKYGETAPLKVNRKPVALADQVRDILHLPLAKGDVRTSSWSKRLDGQQTEYACSDAYAGLRLYYELEKRRKAMASKPPRPAFRELGLNIALGEGVDYPNKPKTGKLASTAQEDPMNDPDAAQNLDDEVNEEDNENDQFFDAAEDLEDPYLDSQDAAEPSLPEITYPTLPPLDAFPSSPEDDETSSLPSDPLEKPRPRSAILSSPEAIAADTWARDWQARLPATYHVSVALPQLRAYHLWHHQGFDVEETAALLRKEPLAQSTVLNYVAEALQKEDLVFEAERLRAEVLDKLPKGVRARYAKLFAKVGIDAAER